MKDKIDKGILYNDMLIIKEFIKMIEYFHSARSGFNLTDEEKNTAFLNKLKELVDENSNTTIKEISKEQKVLFRLAFERFFSDFRFIVGRDMETDNVPIISNTDGFGKEQDYSEDLESFFTQINQITDEEIKVKRITKNIKTISVENLTRIINFSKLVVANPKFIEKYISASHPMDHEMVFTLAFSNIRDYTSNVYSTRDFIKNDPTIKNYKVYLPAGVVMLLEKSIRRSKPESSKRIKSIIDEKKLSIVRFASTGRKKLIFSILESQFDKKESYANKSIEKADIEKELYYFKATKYVQKDSISQPKTDVEIPLYQKSDSGIFVYVGSFRISLKKSNAAGLEGSDVVRKMMSIPMNQGIIGKVSSIITNPKRHLVAIKKTKNTQKSLYEQLGSDRNHIIELMSLLVGGNRLAYFHAKENTFADVEANMFYDFGKIPNKIKNISDLINNSMYVASRTKVDTDEELKKELMRVEDNLVKISKQYTLEEVNSDIKIRLYDTTGDKEKLLQEIIVDNKDDFMNAIALIEKIVDKTRLMDLELNKWNKKFEKDKNKKKKDNITTDQLVTAKREIQKQLNYMRVESATISQGGYKIARATVIAYSKVFSITSTQLKNLNIEKSTINYNSFINGVQEKY